MSHYHVYNKNPLHLFQSRVSILMLCTFQATLLNTNPRFAAPNLLLLKANV